MTTWCAGGRGAGRGWLARHGTSIRLACLLAWMFGHVQRAMCSGGCQFKALDEDLLLAICLHTLLAGGRGAHMLAAWVHSFGKNVGSTFGMPTWHTRLFSVIDEPLQLQNHPAQTSHNFQPDPLAWCSQLQRSKLQPSQMQCSQWQCSQAVGKSVSDQSIAVQPSAAQLQCIRGTVSGRAQSVAAQSVKELSSTE